MRTALIISYIFIALLLIVAFMQWKAIKKIKNIAPAAAPGSPDLKEVSALDWTKQLSERLKERTVQINF